MCYQLQTFVIFKEVEEAQKEDVALVVEKIKINYGQSIPIIPHQNIKFVRFFKADIKNRQHNRDETRDYIFSK